MLAGAFKAEPLFANVRWEAQHDDVRKPVLVVEAPEPGTVGDADAGANFRKTGFCIRIHTTSAVLTAFQRDRLLPNRNGVRADVANDKKSKISLGPQEGPR